MASNLLLHTTFVKLYINSNEKKNKSHHCCEMVKNQSVVEVWMKQAK